MKIKNIMKKQTKTAVKTNVEKLEKNQLEKIIGGIETTVDVKISSSEIKHIGGTILL